jgi:hypothetical protein
VSTTTSRRYRRRGSTAFSRAAGTASIARALNERRIPPPSAHDPVRNKHRSGTSWTLRTVAEILANPRYTGWQVWNRQRTDHNEMVPGDKRTSLGPTRCWNPRSDWVFSTQRAHPALISDGDFLAVQSITAVATPKNQTVRRYQFTGLLVCGICGRRPESHWIHGRAGYRCRHGHTSTQSHGERLRSVYWAERRILGELLYSLSYQGELPLLAGVDDLLSYLRGRDLVIVCGPSAVRLEAESARGTNNPPPHHPSMG